LTDDAISELYDRGRQELEDIGVRLMGTAEIIQTLPARAPAAGA
jgi:hypothetical protein